MDLVQERVIATNSAGSFWYKQLKEDALKTARGLSSVPYLSRICVQANQAVSRTLGECYFHDNNLVITFSDKDVLYYGVKFAVSDATTVTAGDTIYSLKSKLKLNVAWIANSIGNGYYIEDIIPLIQSDITSELPKDYRILFGLQIDKDIHVHTINANGVILREGVDFSADFGIIHFKVNPIELCLGLKFVAESATVRRRNLLSYTLRVNEVYGATDRIMAYYRRSQTFPSFYLAAVQAAGLPVIPATCRILGKTQLNNGCIYSTTIGKYRLDVDHTEFAVGAVLEAGTVIGKELIQGWTNYEDITASSISLDAVLPVQGLSVSTATMRIWDGNTYKPAYTGPADALQKLYSFLLGKPNQPNKTIDAHYGYDTEAVGLKYVFDYLLYGKYIIFAVSPNVPYDMRIRLETFIYREQPLGGIIIVHNNQ